MFASTPPALRRNPQARSAAVPLGAPSHPALPPGAGTAARPADSAPSRAGRAGPGRGARASGASPERRGPGRGRRRGGAGAASLARRARRATITLTPDLGTPGSRRRPRSRRSRRRREAFGKHLLCGRGGGGSYRQEKQQLHFASERQTLTCTRAPGSGNLSPRESAHWEWRQAVPRFPAASPAPSTREARHLPEAVPGARPWKSWHLFGACSLPGRPALDHRCALGASPPRSGALSPPPPTF